MDCKAVQENISLYLDGELPVSKMQLIAEHIEVCAVCCAELSSLEETVALVRSLEPVEAPPGLKGEILERVWADSPTTKFQAVATRWQRAWRQWGRTFSTAAAVILAAVLIGKTVVGPELGLQIIPKAAMEEKGRTLLQLQEPFASEGEKMMSEPRDRMLSGDLALSTERKVIQTAHLVLIIEKLDAAVDSLQKTVQECRGFVQNSNMFRHDSGRGAHYTLRIPAAQLNNVLAQLEKLGDVQNKGTTGQDITEEYVDTDARCRNLVRQEERLLSILEQAGTVEDILQVENQLERVRGEIEALTGRLRYLDNQVELSTVEVELRERARSVSMVQLADEDGLIKRLNRAFTASLNLLLSFASNAVVWLVAALPFIVVGAGVGACLRWFWWHFKHK